MGYGDWRLAYIFQYPILRIVGCKWFNVLALIVAVATFQYPILRIVGCKMASALRELEQAERSFSILSCGSLVARWTGWAVCAG